MIVFLKILFLVWLAILIIATIIPDPMTGRAVTPYSKFYNTLGLIAVTPFVVVGASIVLCVGVAVWALVAIVQKIIDTIN